MGQPAVTPAVPRTMKAVWIERFGGSEVLTCGDRPTPRPAAREVLVAVHAASVNPRDWMIRSGTYVLRALLPRLPFILGSDVAGVVAAVGGQVRRFRPGDRVFAMRPSTDGFGAYAEYVPVRESAVASLPASLDFVPAAAMPLAGLTALQALRDLARLRPGQRVVVVGAVGGVGHYGVQIARALGAARVTGVCSAANRELALELGCDEVLDYRTTRYQEVLREQDVVFDTIGRGHLRLAAPALNRRGAYLTTVPSGRAIASSIATSVWPWGRRSRIVVVRARGRDLELLAGWAESGALRSIVDRVAPLERVAELHDHSRTFRTRGKNVIAVR